MTDFDVTLDNCADEPIHIPGSIQPHGALLALDSTSYKITRVSTNIKTFLGKEPVECLGKHVDEVLNSGFPQRLKQAVGDHTLAQQNPFAVTCDDHFFQIVASLSGDEILLDVEEQVGNDLQFSNFYHKVRNFVIQLTDVGSYQQIFDESVQEIKKLTGFDRVMLYRFDEEYNGQVVAEAKNEELNTFLHQHFPESDIPVQARQLYLRNPIRLIADVNAQPSPILPTDGPPLDLSTSALRSVSPIHIQYLKNMGVGASMSISIVVEDKLWGLIACHHYDSHVVPFQTRDAAVFLGQMVSYLITMRETTDYEKTEGRLNALNALLVERMANVLDFEAGLKKEVDTLMKLVNAEGVAWNLTGKIERFGKSPSKKKVERLFDWLGNQVKGRSEFHTNSLAAINDEFGDIADVASGILVLPLSLKDDFMLVWFRPEVIETKNWGGKPEKVIEFLDDGSHRLMPRSSFNIWKEKVKLRSLPWQTVEVDIALKFRNSLMNYVLSKSERLKEINKQLEKKVKQRTSELRKEITVRKKVETELRAALKEVKLSNTELEQFAYVASHDLQEPLRKIQAFGERLQSVVAKVDDRHADYLKRMLNAAKRMQLLIQNLLSYSRITTNAAPFEKVNLDKIVGDVLADLQLIIEEKDARVSVADLGTITADRNQIHRLFQNIIQNALKFSKDNQPPVVKVEAQRSEHYIHITIEDNGVGFSQEYSEKIFELFERLHGRQSFDGTGLGLAICKKIVERHGGTIQADSQPEEGTVITLSLPLEAEAD